MRAGLLVAALALSSGPACAAYNEPNTGMPQTACVVTTTGGAWSVTWKTAFASATYKVEATTINAAAAPNQTICGFTSRSATATSGTCSVSQASTVGALGASVQPFVAGASGITVCITGAATTQ